MSRAVTVEKDGESYSIPEHRLHDYLAEGYSFAGGQSIDVDTDAGRLTARGQTATSLLGGDGKIVTAQQRQDEQQEAARRAKYDTFGGEILSGIQSFGNTLSFGLAERVSQAIVPADDPDYDPMSQTRRYGKTGALVGDVAGQVVGALALPWGKAAAGIKGARGVGARVLANAGEGAVTSAASALANAKLDNRALSAESLLADTFTGALFGGAASVVGDAVTAIGTKYAARQAAKAAATDAVSALSKAKKATKVANPNQLTLDLPAGVTSDLAAVAQHTDDVIARGMQHTDAAARTATKAADDAKAAFARLVKVGKDDAVTAIAKLPPAKQLEALQAHSTMVRASTAAGEAMGIAAPAATERFGLAITDYAAIAESMGLTDFVPDNAVMNTLMVAVALRRPAAAVAQSAGRSGLLSRAADAVTGQIHSVPVVGGLVDHAVGALGKAKAAASSASTVFARGYKATKAYHPRVATSIFNAVRFYDGDHPVERPQRAEVAFNRRATELAAAVANPERVREAARSQVVDLAGIAPDIASAFVEGAVARTNYLYSKMPKPPRDYPLDDGDWAPSRTEMERFARSVEAATDPYTTLADIERGTITLEAADALRTLYPALFGEFQRGIIDNIAEVRRKLPRDRRHQLSIVMGVPLDRSHDPSFIARMQSDYAPPAEATPGGSGSVTQNDRAMRQVTSDQPTAAQGTYA